MRNVTLSWLNVVVLFCCMSSSVRSPHSVLRHLSYVTSFLHSILPTSQLYTVLCTIFKTISFLLLKYIFFYGPWKLSLLLAFIELTILSVFTDIFQKSLILFRIIFPLTVNYLFKKYIPLKFHIHAISILEYDSVPPQ